jgi:UDP-4-amino-4,6-dideoxy-N-acetyl-beta-L-altrosamine transaminase
MYKIPYGKQDITSDDLKAVENTLKSDFLTQGPKILEFERNFAKYVGSDYAVAVSNGTAALHLCAMVMNVRPGSKVITSPLTFVATANCIEYCGGEIVFGDIDKDTYLLDIKSVRKLLEESPKGTYSGIIPVDFAGLAVNLEDFKELADEFGLWIIEDACHAPGGYFLNSENREIRCGSCNYADLAIFSFHPVKHIAAGEGGMITTNDPHIYEKLLQLRTHGITKNPAQFQNSLNFVSGQSNLDEYPDWYMEMQCLGFNYRLTDIQAALGNSQLNRAASNIHRRRQVASKYYKNLKDCKFIITQSGERIGHAYHLYVLEVEDRNGLYKFLRRQGIFAQIHYFPVHLMPFYREKYNYTNVAPNSEEYYQNCISLPMYPTLSNKEQDYIIQNVMNYYE